MKRLALTRSKAIRELCLECMGYQRHEINSCPDRACPLWEWRRGPQGKQPTDAPLRRQTTKEMELKELQEEDGRAS